MTDPGRVRIWDKDWNCLVDEHQHDGDTVSDVINRAIDNIPDRLLIGNQQEMT